MEQAGIPFEPFVSGADESVGQDAGAAQTVKTVSVRKAEIAAGVFGVKYAGDEIAVVAADTVVAIGGEILGKPSGSAEASEMLKKLQGREHTVYTGVAMAFIAAGNTAREYFMEKTRVFIRELTSDEIASYVETGEPLDKAGAYAIQGRGSLLVEKIDGDYNNVVGLPICAVYLTLKKWRFIP